MEARLTETLLAKGNTLEFLQAVLVGGAVDDGVLQDLAVDAVMIDGGLDGAATVVGYLFNLPRVPPLVVHQTRVVVAFVEILENRREDLGLLIGKRDLLVLRVHHLPFEDIVKERGAAEDILVRGEDTLLLADDQGHNRRGEVAKPGAVLVSVIDIRRCNG